MLSLAILLLLFFCFFCLIDVLIPFYQQLPFIQMSSGVIDISDSEEIVFDDLEDDDCSSDEDRIAIPVAPAPPAPQFVGYLLNIPLSLPLPLYLSSVISQSPPAHGHRTHAGVGLPNHPEGDHQRRPACRWSGRLCVEPGNLPDPAGQALSHDVLYQVHGRSTE